MMHSMHSVLIAIRKPDQARKNVTHVMFYKFIVLVGFFYLITRIRQIKRLTYDKKIFFCFDEAPDDIPSH